MYCLHAYYFLIKDFTSKIIKSSNVIYINLIVHGECRIYYIH
jgi:hypothetical protein